MLIFLADFAECIDLIRNRRLSVTKTALLTRIVFADRHRWTRKDYDLYLKAAGDTDTLE